MAESNLERLRKAVGAIIYEANSPTADDIREEIDRLRLAYEITDAEAEKLARDLEACHSITMSNGAVLEEEHIPWLADARAEIDPYYWGRYKKLLGQRGFSNQVISTLDAVTEKSLGLLSNPNSAGRWDRRGMVVGHVQSGKTANYLGLICKAADAGYKLIVVIAGIHNNLRNQTQARIDEGFIGRDSSRLLARKTDKIIGVGRFDSRHRPFTLTNTLEDFNKRLASGAQVNIKDLQVPTVLVIKKNSHTLRSLIDWLREHSTNRDEERIAVPMLLIDDEADNASVNIQYHKEGVSTINRQIRAFLELFDRSCYVGYTATPFANIFIDPDTDDEMFGADLFPRDFIVSLDPPSNYFGPEKVFLDEQSSRRTLLTIDDSEDLLPLRHKKDHRIPELPPSLREAVRTFVLARAIRLARGHEGQHSSMLINASRFTNLQDQLKNEVHHYLSEIQQAVRIHGAKPSRENKGHAIFDDLAATWESQYKEHGEPRDWEVIYQKLNEAASPIMVVAINGVSADSLNYVDYPNGLHVIAVGGFSLSRGLTLEGLMVSYFLRRSLMYDTLMQMGRWFGYRPDYEDLCRIWMPEEAVGWYAHIAESTEDLRAELREMERRGQTPKEFGLKVRSHPDSLMITARNKVGTGQRAKVMIGLSNRFVETTTLKAEKFAKHREIAAALVQRVQLAGYTAHRGDQGHLFTGVPVEFIEEFLRTFDNHPLSNISEIEPILQYISPRKETEMSEWDILFVSNRQGSGRTVDFYGLKVQLQQRTIHVPPDCTPNDVQIGTRQRVASRGIEMTALSEEEIERARESFRREHPEKGESPNYPDRIYRALRKRPLLLVHLLELKDASKTILDSGNPVVAWSLSLPSTELKEDRVEYFVNKTYFREEDLEFDEDPERASDAV
jgi:hypothetical protein